MYSTTGLVPDAAELSAAFAAVADGTATPAQVALRDAVLATVSTHSNDPGVVAAVADAVGPFTTVYDEPYDSLTKLQKWVRDQAAAADRTDPPLGDMASVYRQLLAAEDNSGSRLRLAPGSNIIGLDERRSRWLMPVVKPDVARRVAAATDEAEVRRMLRLPGNVAYHWSIERSTLVPPAEVLAEKIPLPTGGTYLICYQGPVEIVTKDRWRAAISEIAAAHPVADVLIWQRTTPPTTLWSIRGMLGHAEGHDIDWPDELAATASSLRDEIWP